MTQPAVGAASARRPWRDPALGVALLLGPLAWAVMWFLDWPGDGTRDIRAWLFGALLYPVMEELAFRAGLQATLSERFTVLRERFAGISLANLFTASAFAAMHLINRPPLAAVMVLLPALVFGWAWDRYQRVWPCVLLHMVYNAGFLWWFAS